MRVAIVTRHCEVPDDVRERAEAQVERLARLARRPESARVLFAEDAGVPNVELQLQTAVQRHVARADGRTLRAALDLALGRLRRQLVSVPKPSRPRRRVTE